MDKERHEYERKWRIINKYKYFCDDCIWHSSNLTEYKRHMGSSTHCEKMVNTPPYVFKYCRPCHSFCLTEKDYLDHCKQKRHKYKLFVLLDPMIIPVLNNVILSYL